MKTVRYLLDLRLDFAVVGKLVTSAGVAGAIEKTASNSNGESVGGVIWTRFFFESEM